MMLLFCEILLSLVYSFECNGVNRCYNILNVLKVDSPLIINLHGFRSNMYEQSWYTNLHTYASEYAVVYPQGLSNSCNVCTPWDNNNNDDTTLISFMIVINVFQSIFLEYMHVDFQMEDIWHTDWRVS